jgi:hypothetical protein
LWLLVVEAAVLNEVVEVVQGGIVLQPTKLLRQVKNTLSL